MENEINVFDGLFSLISPQQSTSSHSWLKEISLYLEIPNLSGKGDPLEWWRSNEKLFPILSTLLYLITHFV